MSDVTKRGEIFGLESTTYFGALLQHADGVERYAQRHAGRQRQARPSAEQHLERHVELWRSRARRTQADAEPDGGCRHRMGSDPSEGDQHRLQLSDVTNVRRRRSSPIVADRQFQNTAPELALLYKLNHRVAVPGARRHRLRHAAGRQPLRPFERSERQQHAAQDADRTSVTIIGFDWTPNNTLKFSATGFYEFFRNELVTQATQVGAPNTSFTFNAPKSEHRGVELAADWKFYPGWRFTAAYTYLDQFYTEYTERHQSSGATSSASTVPATRSPASRRTN